MKTILTLGLIVHFFFVGALLIRTTEELTLKKLMWVGLYFFLFHIAYLLFVKFNIDLITPEKIPYLH